MHTGGYSHLLRLYEQKKCVEQQFSSLFCQNIVKKKRFDARGTLASLAAPKKFSKNFGTQICYKARFSLQFAVLTVIVT